MNVGAKKVQNAVSSTGDISSFHSLQVQRLLASAAYYIVIVMHFSHLILALAGLCFTRLVAAEDLPERFPNWNCLSVQQPPIEEWIFYPVNGTYSRQNAATEKAIRGIIGDEPEMDRYISFTKDCFSGSPTLLPPKHVTLRS